MAFSGAFGHDSRQPDDAATVTEPAARNGLELRESTAQSVPLPIFVGQKFDFLAKPFSFSKNMMYIIVSKVYQLRPPGKKRREHKHNAEKESMHVPTPGSYFRS